MQALGAGGRQRRTLRAKFLRALGVAVVQWCSGAVMGQLGRPWLAVVHRLGTAGQDRLAGAWGEKTTCARARRLAGSQDHSQATSSTAQSGESLCSLDARRCSALAQHRAPQPHERSTQHQHHSRRAHTSITTALHMHMHNPDRASSVLCRALLSIRVWAPPLRVTSPEAAASRFCAAQRGLGNHGLVLQHLIIAATAIVLVDRCSAWEIARCAKVMQSAHYSKITSRKKQQKPETRNHISFNIFMPQLLPSQPTMQQT